MFNNTHVTIVSETIRFIVHVTDKRNTFSTTLRHTGVVDPIIMNDAFQ